MSGDYIGGVLGVLRRIKATQHLSLQHTSLTYMVEWSGGGDPSAALAMASSIQEQLRGAQSVIEASSLTTEAKSGLLVTIAGLVNAFSLAGLNGQLAQFIPALDPAITNFAIISSLSSSTQPDSLSQTINNLIRDIDELADSAKACQMDQVLRDTIVRNLVILATMLRNVEAVGIDGAVTSYFDLLVRVRRSEKSASNESKKSMHGFWPAINSLGEKIGKISGLLEAGMKLISYAEKLPNLLENLQN